MNEKHFVKRAAEGDERAFAAIYERYHQDLYRYCLAIVRNPQDAQDALQNTMVKVLRSLPGETRRIELKPWLYRIAHNESVELLRRHRACVELEPELIASGGGLAEAAETRERLRLLLDDLAELPERQRAALVMRELAGLGFDEVGAAFDTSDAAARQTVYEARLSLRQMKAGREMHCKKVMWELSEADGRVLRRREIQAHLRSCRECRSFQEEIAKRRHDLAAISPLPLAVSAGLLQGLLGGAGAGGALTGTVAAGAGKTAVTSAVLKATATVAVVAAGVTAADRGGLIETPLPSQIGGAKSSGPVPGAPAPGMPTQPVQDTALTRNAGGKATADPHGPRSTDMARTTRGEDAPAEDETPNAVHGQGHADGLPAASSHGQQTAAEHAPAKSKSAKANGAGSKPDGDKAKGAGKAAAGHSPAGNPPRGSRAGGVGSGGRSGSAPKGSAAQSPAPHPAAAKQAPSPDGSATPDPPAKGSSPKD